MVAQDAGHTKSPNRLIGEPFVCLRVHALRRAGAGSASKAKSLPFSDGQGLHIAADVAFDDVIKSALDINQ